MCIVFVYIAFVSFVFFWYPFCLCHFVCEPFFRLWSRGNSEFARQQMCHSIYRSVLLMLCVRIGIFMAATGQSLKLITLEYHCLLAQMHVRVRFFVCVRACVTTTETQRKQNIARAICTSSMQVLQVSTASIEGRNLRCVHKTR